MAGERLKPKAPRQLGEAPGGLEEEEEALTLHTTVHSQGFTSMHFHSTCFSALRYTLLLLLLTAFAGPLPADHRPSRAEVSGEETTDSTTSEHWYRVDISRAPAGWMLHRETRQADRLSTVSILHLRFRRGPSEQTLELESRFVETLDNRPLSAWARQHLGPKPVETSWKFERDTVWVETTHDSETRRERMPWPPSDWLTPGQLQARLRQRLADGSKTFTLTGLDPQLGLEAIETEWRLDARDDNLILGGQTRRAMRYVQRQPLTPHLETIVHVTAEGLLLRSVTPMMGLEMTLSLSTREEALTNHDAPELLLRSFIYPDQPIPKPRRARRVLYEIQAESGALEPLPSTGSQRVSATSTSQRVLVEVGSSPVLEGDERPDPAEYLRSSTMLDHRDDVVRQLTGKVEFAEPGVAAHAEALRAFVASYLDDKNLDSILATASEAATTRSGDCTEHSVLLAALLRAEGIPSRVVTGLVYVDELLGQRRLFGYHMWTQALIDNRWIDLDATLARPFDAAHIALGTTALNDGSSALRELSTLATLLGNARIQVLEVEH